MKKLFLFIFTIISLLGPVLAQNDLVDWSFNSKKISGDTYEIRLQATLKKGWHIYSQNPGKGPLPTTVSYIKSPLITLEGKLNEVGNLKRERSEVFNTEIRYYENTMILVQRIKLKANVKTTFKGNINYMVCSSRQCLPPLNKAFTIAITS